MRLHAVGAGITALLLAGGCAHNARVNSVNLAEAGTYVVTTPGALTIARQNATSPRTCTLRTEGFGKRKPGAPAKAGRPGQPGRPGMPGMPGMRAGAPGAGGAGPGAMLDVLLFRLCEARSNNDITADQYASSVQIILKTMSDMAEHRPPPPGAGMRGPWWPPGARDRESGERRWRERRDRDDRDDGDRGDRDDEGGPDRERREGPPGGPDARRWKGPGPGVPAGPPHKDDEKPKAK